MRNLVLLSACFGWLGLGGLGLACGSPPESEVPAASAITPPATVTTAQSAPDPVVPPEMKSAIEAFASERGGLAAGPFKVRYRTHTSPNAPCYLFFVGADWGGKKDARAAWVITRGAVAQKQASGGEVWTIPGVTTQGTAVHQGEMLFEAVNGWPRAVRVLDSAQTTDGAAVLVESFASRDQPAGLRGVIYLGEDIGSGSAMVANAFGRDTWRLFGVKDGLEVAASQSLEKTFDAPEEEEAKTFVRSATLSGASLAKSFSPNGADVYELWQGALARKVDHVDASTIGAASKLDAILDIGRISVESCNAGVCTGPAASGSAGGLILEKKGAALHLGTILIPGTPNPKVSESAPKTLPATDEPILRAFVQPSGTWHPVVRADVGEGRTVSVSYDDAKIFVTEDDGAFSAVSEVLYFHRGPPASIQARIVDVDGDGINDVVVFASWDAVKPKDKNDVAYPAQKLAAVILRGSTVSEAPDRDLLGREIDALGARDLDDAIKLASGPRPEIQVTVEEACVALKAASAPTGFRSHATPDAVIDTYSEPGEPGWAGSIVTAKAAKASDLAIVGGLCAGTEDAKFSCKGSVCGALATPLGSSVRFVRKGKQLLIDRVLDYGGS